MRQGKKNGVKQAHPTVPELVRWLTSHTRPVHKPLYVSTLFRIINLSLDIVIFALAAGGITAVVTRDISATSVLLILVGLALVKALCYYLEQLTGHYVAFKALELLRTLAFSQLWPKAPAIVSRARSGDVLTSLTRDVDRIEVVYAHTFAPVVSAVVVPPLFVIGTGIVWGWATAAIPALCVLLSLFAVPFIGLRSSMKATHQTLGLRRDLSHHLTDSVFGAEEVVGYGRISERLNDMEKIEDTVSASAARARRGNGMRRAGNLLLTVLCVIGVAYVAMASGHSVVVVATLVGGSLRLFEGARGVEDAAGYLDYSLAAARRLWDICHEPAAVEEGSKVLELAGPPSISLRNITYTYPQAHEPALNDVSIEVPSGGHVVLVGPSGSGKSTTVNMLLRYDNPHSGHVLINGEPVDNFTFDSLRSNVVVVSQRNQLLNTTIRENVLLGAPHSTDKDIWNALELACVAQDVKEMPDGLETWVGQAGSQLSGGQAQRLCLARALMMKPRVLVLDEFTAQLNSELEKTIRANIETLGVTIIEVTHRLDLVTSADSIVLMDRGRVVACGSPSHIEKTDGSLKEFFTRNV